MANQETQFLDDMIVKSRRKLLTLGGAAVAGLAFGGSTPKAEAQSATYSDNDILNFALNLEYLEANFYYLAAFGTTIDKPNAASMAAFVAAGGTATAAAQPIPITISGGGVGTAGTVTGGSKAAISTVTVGSYATETAIEEGKHVVALQAALGSLAVNQPAINLAAGNGGSGSAITGAFGILANAAQIPNGSSFSPYTSDANFLIGAYVFEDVGVTAYHGAASLLTGTTTTLPIAAGILGVEAYHAGLVRTSLLYMDQANNNTALTSLTTLISALRNTLSQAALTALGVAGGTYDGNPDDYGIGNFLTPSGIGGGSPVTATRIVDADSTNIIAFARNTTQILNIVTGGGKVSGTTVNATATGVFFPNGLNAGPNGFK